MSNTIVVHWWEDSYGRRTCHRNERGLDFKESYLGIIIQITDSEYYYQLSGSLERVGPFNQYSQAARAVENAVGGKQIDPRG